MAENSDGIQPQGSEPQQQSHLIAALSSPAVNQQQQPQQVPADGYAQMSGGGPIRGVSQQGQGQQLQVRQMPYPPGGIPSGTRPGPTGIFQGPPQNGQPLQMGGPPPQIQMQPRPGLGAPPQQQMGPRPMSISQSQPPNMQVMNHQAPPPLPMGTQIAQQPPIPIPMVGTLLDKEKLDELARQIEPNMVLEENVKDALVEIADEFVDEIIDKVCRLVQHRGNKRLEVRDVELVLDMVYKMPRVPRAAVHVFGAQSAARVDEKLPMTLAHQQRLQLLRKSLKKS